MKKIFSNEKFRVFIENVADLERNVYSIHKSHIKFSIHFSIFFVVSCRTAVYNCSRKIPKVFCTRKKTHVFSDFCASGLVPGLGPVVFTSCFEEVSMLKILVSFIITSGGEYI